MTLTTRHTVAIGLVAASIAVSVFAYVRSDDVTVFWMIPLVSGYAASLAFDGDKKEPKAESSTRKPGFTRRQVVAIVIVSVGTFVLCRLLA